MRLHWLLVVFILLCSVNTSLSQETHWNYGDAGPDVWEDSYAACQGMVQSPINIQTACTVYNAYPAFQLSSATNVVQNFTITNDGHTITASQVDKTAFPLTLSGGGLNGTYEFVNFHLHWGQNYKSGSEHQINSENYAGEIHCVYLNSAINQYAVLGIFIQTIKSNSSSSESTGHKRKKRKTKRETINTNNDTLAAWEQYFSTADPLNDTNESAGISLQLSTLMNTNLNNFYRYSGSLTTPPCSENVIWSVFQTPIQISDDELEMFRLDIFSENFRNPQPLNKRIVYRSFPNDTSPSKYQYTCCTSTEGKDSRGSILIYQSYLWIFHVAQWMYRMLNQLPIP
ncbi:unnamed protein product [Rotaria sp. Silwood1]|nr:unnamed protein product [Rotaria sp. Silwood1]